MALDFKRYRWTVREYEEMGRAGILVEDARVELLDGEIVEMPPMGGRHFFAAMRVEDLFHRAFRGAAMRSTCNHLRTAIRVFASPVGGESIAPQALPDRSVAVGDLLPEPDAATS